MGVYRDQIVPRLIDFAMRQQALRACRERTIGGAEGRVLEIGAGSGLNLPLYGSAARSIVAVERSPQLLRLASRRAATAKVPVEFVEGSAEALPLPDASIDTVVTTWTLCSIPDAARALLEARRVLRPGGSLLFVEHGRGPEPGVRRWQDRLDPLWSRFAGGCHLNRPIDRLLREAGFRLDRLHNFRLPGPRTHTFMYEGRAD